MGLDLHSVVAVSEINNYVFTYLQQDLKRCTDDNFLCLAVIFVQGKG